MKGETILSVMTALVGESIHGIMSLVDGYRIARILEQADNKCFNFFGNDVRKSLVLKDPTKLNETQKEETRRHNWSKIIKSMLDYFKERSENIELDNSKICDWIKILESLQDDLINKLIEMDQDSMRYFCMIFIIFIKSMFPNYWIKTIDVMDSQIKEDFEEEISEFYNNGAPMDDEDYTIEGTEIDNSQLDNISDFSDKKKLLGFIDRLEKDNLFKSELLLKKDEKISILESKLKETKASLEKLQQVKLDSGEKALSLEMRLNQLQQDYDNLSQQRQQAPSTIKKDKMRADLFEEELDLLRRENSRLENEIRLLRLQQGNHMMLLSIDSKHSIQDEIVKLRDQNQHMKHLKENKDAKIEALEDSIKRLKNLELSYLSKIEILTAENKRWIESCLISENKIKNSKQQHDLISSENVRLQEDIAQLKIVVANLQKKNESLYSNSVKSSHDSNDSRDISKEESNLYKVIEEISMYYKQEIAALYALLHDHLISQLTGKSLQDVVKQMLACRGMKSNQSIEQSLAMML